MSCTVYVLGAGASHGDDLGSLGLEEATIDPGARPPLANGFFTAPLLSSIAGSPEAFTEYLKASIQYLHIHWSLDESLRSAQWNNLSLEQVLSHVEMEMEFLATDTKNWMDRLKVREELVNHIHRIIGCCTAGKFGRAYRLLAAALGPMDTVISFNWDLLLDLELLSNSSCSQYRGFLESFNVSPPGSKQVDFPWETGLFLKPHGSLNWFRCPNAACPTKHSLVFKDDVQGCLKLATLAPQWAFCANCGEKTFPLIAPPISRKKITEDPIIRHVWGLARRKLQFADKLVVIGFSFAPSDFYAEWLLRSSAYRFTMKNTFVVNPLNDPKEEGHRAFHARMKEIFPRGFNSQFLRFSEVEEIVDRVRGRLPTSS